MEKEVAYYEAVVGAWVDTQMEFDKSLLTLSVAGIGLIVTLVTTVEGLGAAAFVMFAVAACAFVGTLVACLVIFKQNARYLASVAQGEAGPADDPHLTALDRFAQVAFGVGVVLTLIAGGLAGWKKGSASQATVPPAAPGVAATPVPVGVLTPAGVVPSAAESGKTMKGGGRVTEQKPGSNGGESSKGDGGGGTPRAPEASPRPLNESINGMRRLQPDTSRVSTGSVSGITSLRPKPPAPSKPNGDGADTNKTPKTP